MRVYLPNHLNHRRLILGLPVEEFLLAVLPPALGFLMRQGAVGLGVALVSVLALRALKRLAGGVSPYGLAYRFLPITSKGLTPSHWIWVGG